MSSPDGLLALPDVGGLEERGDDPVAQRPLPHGGDAVVEAGQQGALGSASRSGD